MSPRPRNRGATIRCATSFPGPREGGRMLNRPLDPVVQEVHQRGRSAAGTLDRDPRLDPYPPP
jgi:hypothetical protein